MCIVLAAWQVHPDYPLVIAANRDEFFARPTRPARFWSDVPATAHILAGRDLQAGGTWLGVTRGGRFAALTNYRDPQRERSDVTSGGALVSGFLQGNAGTDEYLAGVSTSVASGAVHYNGFNLVVCDGRTLACYNNIERRTRILEPGIHGLSNHVMNTPWPKVTAARDALQRSLHQLPDTDGLFDFLRDDTLADDADLPATGIPLERERALSAIFVRNIVDMNYGTRNSTVLTIAADGRIRFDEREWNPDASCTRRQRFSFSKETA